MSLLDNPQKKRLRTAMMGAFTADTLNLFAEDHLDVDLDTVIDLNPPDGLQVAFQFFIKWADDSGGKILTFLQAVLAEHGNAQLRTVASELIDEINARAPVTTGNGASRPLDFRGRVVIDRDSLWTRATALEQAGANRTIVVTGGVGKSHSIWMLSYLCDPALNDQRLVTVRATDAKEPVTPAKLGSLLATRLWADPPISDDTLAQDTRDAKTIASLLINRLAALPTPTWLVIDELDAVNLGSESLAFLARIGTAVDEGQCPNVWLFLIGLDPSKVDPRIAQFPATDLVERPALKAIKDFILGFAKRFDKTLSAEKVTQVVGTLNAILPQAPTYADWTTFHTQLIDRCNAIKNNTL